jgi:hypothetical protein
MTALTWRQQSALRRDDRATKTPDGPLKGRGKKDRKPWCGGHVGREHTPQCRRYKEGRVTYLTDWRELVCTTCGRQMDVYGPSFHRIVGKPLKKPEWVTL